MNLIHCFLIILLFISCIVQNNNVNAKVDVPDDAYLNPREIVEKYGHEFEEYNVTSEDGYILKMFHIIGHISKPVLLAHGLLAEADSFLFKGQTSMAIALADEGYDVWLINCRGNRFSRGHTSLNADTDNAYWDFTFDEMGTKDLPAAIDFVLDKTGQTQIPIIGHSQGTQINFVLGSLKPEYNVKMSIIIALAPVAYLHHLPSPFPVLIPLWPAVNTFLKASGTEELFKANSTLLKFYISFCLENDVFLDLCRNLFFTLAGYDPPQLEHSFMPVVVEKFPTSASRKNIDHLVQIRNSRRFARYDYGLGNLLKYGSLEPPEYPVHEITARVALLPGRSDRLSTIADVNDLRPQLQNVIYHELEGDKRNHIDFIWGRDMSDYLFPLVFDLLENGEITQNITLFGNDCSTCSKKKNELV